MMKQGSCTCRAKRFVVTLAYKDSCQGVGQLGGLVPVVRLGVLLRCKASNLGDPLRYPLDKERTLVWQ